MLLERHGRHKDGSHHHHHRRLSTEYRILCPCHSLRYSHHEFHFDGIEMEEGIKRSDYLVVGHEY